MSYYVFPCVIAPDHGIVNKVSDFEWKCGQYPSSSDNIMHMNTCSKILLPSYEYLYKLFKTTIAM